MDTMSPSQANAEVIFNRAMETLEHAQVYGRRQSTSTGLTWGYYGGRWGGFSISAGTHTLSNNVANYIVVAKSTGAASVSTATTNWNNDTDYARVYKVTTASSVVSAVEDHRAGPGGVHYGSGTGGGGGTLPWFDVTDSGAVADGVILRDVATTNADATVTSATANWTAADIGKVFEVTNNATVFKSTIASINSTTSIELSATVTFTATGCVAHYGTDDTSAIQDAIDACEAAGGGTVFFPRGVYIVNGALQDTSRSNSQLLLPLRHTGTATPLTINLLGESAGCPLPSVAAAVLLPGGGSIIKGTLNTTGGTSPALIGGHGPSGSAADFSNTHVVIKNLTFRMPVNPVLTAVDLSHMACAEVDAVVIDSGQYDVRSASLAEPTTTSSYGLAFPKQSNGAHSVIGSCDVIGFYFGYQFAEHANGVNVNAWGCKRAFEFSATDHASVFQRVMACHCEQVLVAGGGAHRLQIQQLNVEHAASGWNVTDYDINDASNYLSGDLRWHVVLAGTGVDATFTVNGATGMRRRRIGADRVQTLSDGATINTNCDLGSSFSVTLGGNRTLANPTAMQDGDVYNWRVTQDGTGSRTLAYGSKFKFPGGAPTLTTTAAAVDFISCQYDAAKDTLMCGVMLNMS